MRLELHLAGNLRDDGALDEAPLFDLGHRREIQPLAVLNSLAARSQRLTRQNDTFLDLNVLIKSGACLDNAVLIDNDAICD